MRGMAADERWLFTRVQSAGALLTSEEAACVSFLLGVLAFLAAACGT